jgi:hypothetical protein
LEKSGDLTSGSLTFSAAEVLAARAAEPRAEVRKARRLVFMSVICCHWK